MLADLISRAFQGSAALMVATLLDSKNVNEQDLQEIRRLIVEREEE